MNFMGSEEQWVRSRGVYEVENFENFLPNIIYIKRNEFSMIMTTHSQYFISILTL